MNLSTLLKVRRALLDVPKAKEIDIVLQSPGGSAAHAYRLIRTFRERYEKVNIIIPYWAKSAATLFAFGGTRIVLHEFGELGPIDAQIKKDDENAPEAWASALNVQSSLEQIEQRSRTNLLELFEKLQGEEGLRISRRSLANMLLEHESRFYKPLMEKIDTIEIGIMARYLNIAKMYAIRILKEYTDTDNKKRDELVDFLIYECPEHGYVIDYNILKEYLPNVIRADESPFDPEYYGMVERLSILFMAFGSGRVDDIVGFVKDLTAKKSQEDKVKSVNKEEGNDKQDTGKKSNPRRSSKQSGSKSSSTKPSKRNSRTKK